MCWDGDGPLRWDVRTVVPVPCAQAPFASVDDFTHWVPWQEGQHPQHGKLPPSGCPQHTSDTATLLLVPVLCPGWDRWLCSEKQPCAPSLAPGCCPLFASPPCTCGGSLGLQECKGQDRTGQQRKAPRALRKLGREARRKAAARLAPVHTVFCIFPRLAKASSSSSPSTPPAPKSTGKQRGGQEVPQTW